MIITNGMNENILEISKENLYLHINRGFIIIEENNKEIGRVDIDTISILLITNNNNAISIKTFERLLEKNIAVVICGSNFIPIGILQPLNNHNILKARLDLQINVKKALKDRLWQTIIKRKIYNQTQILKNFNLEYEDIKNISKNISIGDKENLEAKVARIYFSRLFNDTLFRRDKENIINALLNYGYAVVRGATARAVASSGLNPALGIHHKNQFDSYCLVDDLMEPFRANVDFVVKNLVEKREIEELTPEIKKELVKVLSMDLKTEDNKITTLSNSLIRLSQTLVSSYENNKVLLEFPTFIIKNGIIGI